jgi:hypothetical protein
LENEKNEIDLKNPKVNSTTILKLRTAIEGISAVRKTTFVPHVMVFITDLPSRIYYVTEVY